MLSMPIPHLYSSLHNHLLQQILDQCQGKRIKSQISVDAPLGVPTNDGFGRDVQRHVRHHVSFSSLIKILMCLP